VYAQSWLVLLTATVFLGLSGGCKDADPDDPSNPDDDDDDDDNGDDDDTYPPPELEMCGEDWDGMAPLFDAVDSAEGADGQVAQYCGDAYPTVGLANDDPFADERYQAPPDWIIPPYEDCIAALEESIDSRKLCEHVTGRRDLLVSKDGDSDPRWQGGDFDALYGTIQAAIDDADHCDHIIVRPGTYQEYLVIDGKDVQISSDTWNEDGTAEDGDEMVNYTAERIDLLEYYDTGERTVVDTRQTFMKVHKRATRTILQGGGYDEGPELGGQIEHIHDDPTAPNAGCGNRRPMVDFKAGTTRNTIFDGFSVRLMPEQDHTIPGHGHTLQCRGGSPIIRYNIIYNNGSTGAGVHASFVETTPVTPECEFDPSLEQETFSNDDYRHTNVEYRPVPLIYGNISYQNNGLGLGNNHYSCAVMMGNESFWNAVPEELETHQSPGIGTRHGAKTCIDLNIVYDNAWTGIATHQGYLQPADDCAEDPANCNHIDERTQAMIGRNIVFDNGWDGVDEDNQGGLSLDGVGLPDDPVIVRQNLVFDSHTTGIGVRNIYAGEAEGFVMDDSYVEMLHNTSFSNARQGLTCAGSDFGTAHCTIAGNHSFWNHDSGIGFTDDAQGAAVNNVSACNTGPGFQSMEALTGQGISFYNNIAWANVVAGTTTPGAEHDYNILSANAGQGTDCGDDPSAQACMNPQFASQQGGAAGANDLFVDPEFFSATGFGFFPASGSPAIDSGMDISPFYADWPVAGASYDRGSAEQ